MQIEVPLYLLHFRNSRSKSCPRSPLLLDLLVEIFSLLFSHSTNELKTQSVHGS